MDIHQTVLMQNIVKKNRKGILTKTKKGFKSKSEVVTATF